MVPDDVKGLIHGLAGVVEVLNELLGWSYCSRIQDE